MTNTLAKRLGAHTVHTYPESIRFRFFPLFSLTSAMVPLHKY